jgi:hypothetical protein
VPSYTVYNGLFLCQTCKIEVRSLRLYAETKTITWMCKEKHISTVNLGKRKKSDFDRKK